MNDTRPLNILKFCPKCGSGSFISPEGRCFKCNDCGFVFFINSSAAVAALFTDNEGKLLLTVRGVEPGYGMLDLPGGFVNPGESAENAVKRELKEELGIQVKNLEYLDSAPNEYIFKGYSVFTLDIAFLVTPETTEGMKARDDIIDYRFYSEEEIDYSKIPAPSINYFVRQFFVNRLSGL